MTADQKFDQLTNGSTITGAVIGGVGALTLTQWLAIGGFVLALAGFLVNLWHKRQMVKLRRQEIQMKAAELEARAQFAGAAE